jgi:hypothetical protein
MRELNLVPCDLDYILIERDSAYVPTTAPIFFNFNLSS